MSMPSHYMQQGPQDRKEDCRDYLRTGRCKYGASCKYNHPPNVQSGGGMKAPIDPSEPLFPVRPNEPVCQYYMKHSTCKFGQACKFHHPPLGTGPMQHMGGQHVLLNMGGRSNDSQMLWGSGADAGMQVLPQRPNEPDCIFYLKNGRCKYGSTCRYHHPLNVHDQQQQRKPMSNLISSDNLQQGQQQLYVSVPSNAYQQQGHFVVIDGAVNFVSADGTTTPAQVISVPSNQNVDKGFPYSQQGHQQQRPLVMSRDVGSSTSSTSIASSYDTAGSSLDPTMGSGHGDSSSSLWNNRPNRVGSGTSLNAYNMVESRGQMSHGNRAVLIQSGSDGTLVLPRVASSGSNSEAGSTVYYDTHNPASRQGSQHSSPGSSSLPWRGRRSSSFDHSRQGQYSQDDDMHRTSSVPHSLNEEDQHSGSYYKEHRAPMSRGRPPQGPRSQRRPQHNGGSDDDGLTMMTSALLTMLDTTDEAGEGYDYDENSQASTPRARPQYPSSASHYQSNSAGDNDASRQRPSSYIPYPDHDHSYSYDSEIGNTPQHGPQDHRVQYGHPQFQYNDRNAHYGNSQHTIDNRRPHPTEDEDWRPSWQSQPQMEGRIEDRSRLMQSRNPPSQSHDNSNIGLYLP